MLGYVDASALHPVGIDANTNPNDDVMSQDLWTGDWGPQDGPLGMSFPQTYYLKA
jgi:hypothetical protein